jgi:hypothetical protein
MSGFGGAGFVGAGSGSDGSSDDRPSPGGMSGGGTSCGGPSGDGASGGANADGCPRTDSAPHTVECMLSDVQGLCLLNNDTSSSFKREAGPPSDGPSPPRGSVQAVIARLDGMVEESMETRSEDSFHVRHVAPVVVQQRKEPHVNGSFRGGRAP